jgi:hypothetical protein
LIIGEKRMEKGKTAKTEKIKNKKLLKEYPFLVPVNWEGNRISAKDHNYEFTALDDIPKGWKKMFLQFCEDIKPVLIKGNYLNEYYFVQLKEKYGSIRIYDNGVPSSIREEVSRLISDYEIISKNICVDCGSPYAKMCNVGWVSPFCEKCFKKYYYNIDYNSATKESDVMDNFYKITRWGNGSRTEEIIDISDKVARIKSKWRV